MTDTVIRYTTAEPAYDWSFTSHMGVVGFDQKGRAVRKVHIEQGRENEQCERYRSGVCMAIDHIDYAKQVEHGFIIPVSERIEVDAKLAGAVLTGLADALKSVTEERKEIAKDRELEDSKNDEYMLGALDGRDAALYAAAETLSTLHALLTKAGV